MATIYLGLRIKSYKLEKITLHHVDLSEKVETFKVKVAEKSKTPVDKLQLVHYGEILKGSQTLQEAGISSGAMIHCLPKRERTLPEAERLDLIEVQQLLVSLRAAVASPNFRSFIQKLRGPEMVEKILMACPVIQKDPVALAMLQDPELFVALTNPDNLSKIVEAHPALGRVAQYVAALITAETSPRRSHHVSYSMDALSDDEEDMDADNVGSAGGSGDASISFQPITPAQLAAALANATGGLNSSSGSGSLRLPPPGTPRSIPTTPSATTTTPFNTPLPTSSLPSYGSTSSTPGPITNEMFSQALQNALAASASRGTTAPYSAPISNSDPARIPNLEESLQLMREMGIPDEDMSRQALLATSGDVQAAVNLIFAQWMADD